MGTVERLLSSGYRVVALSPEDEYVQKLREKGVEHRAIYIERSSKNPFKELLTYLSYRKVYSEIRPDAILSFTPKCNIYGAFAAKVCRAKVINNIAGLGSIFVSGGFVSVITRQLYKLSQKFAHHVFFQNEEDMCLFLDKKIVERTKCSRIPGSGVNLSKFKFDENQKENKIRFILVARMLYEKGILLYVNAAERIKDKYPDTEFALLGQLDLKNPSGIPSALIENWHNKQLIRYLGKTDDVAAVVKQYSAVVLPSYYREGVPRSLLEAAALGKPIITTNNIGCRDTVVDKVSGFLCKTKDSDDLTNKLEQFINLSPEKRQEMGRCGRRHIEHNFDEEMVINEYIRIIES
jgi:glycosyltransferase involved in cell wall biosynthesis